MAVPGAAAALETIDESFDLALLDVGLPDGNGFSLCSEIKQRCGTPIIFLTASGDEFSVVTGLVVELEGLRVDTEKAQVTKGGREVYLSALEYKLLLVFLNNRGRVLSRSKLLEEIWDVGGDFVNDNTLTVYIKRLRDKIEDDPAEPRYIKTVRGLGYKL